MWLAFEEMAQFAEKMFQSLKKWLTSWGGGSFLKKWFTFEEVVHFWNGSVCWKSVSIVESGSLVEEVVHFLLKSVPIVEESGLLFEEVAHFWRNSLLLKKWLIYWKRVSIAEEVAHSLKKYIVHFWRNGPFTSWGICSLLKKWFTPWRSVSLLMK